jgi:hypothetical protein
MQITQIIQIDIQFPATIWIKKDVMLVRNAVKPLWDLSTFGHLQSSNLSMDRTLNKRDINNIQKVDSKQRYNQFPPVASNPDRRHSVLSL